MVKTALTQERRITFAYTLVMLRHPSRYGTFLPKGCRMGLMDGPAHLRRSQAYASLGQGFLHIVQEGKDIPVDMNHGPAFLSQKRISVLKNIKNHGRQDDMDKRV